MPWALAAIPDGPQNRQAALNTNGTENAQARKITKSWHNIKNIRDRDGSGEEHVKEKIKEIYKLRAQEEKVSHSQVKDVDREGIPAHVEAQKPHHDGISCHPNQGKDEGKINRGLEHDFTI